MNAMILPLIAIVLLGGGPAEYVRPLDSKHLDQPTLDAEGFGEKKAFAREEGGLRIRLEVGKDETGWKTPQQLKIGGDFVITAELLIKTLPKPNQEDGAAFGLAIAFQDINHPDLTFLRLREPNGQDVYRSVDKGLMDPMMQQQIMMQRNMMMMQMANGMGGPGAQPPKPPRKTFPTSGELARMELKREGNNVQLQVNDVATGRQRYLGQVYVGPNDVSAIKLFASNRNGVEPLDVLIQGLSIRAARINGLGTAVRTVFGTVAYGDPTAIEDGKLIVGGPPKTPPGAPANGPVGPPKPPGNAPTPVAAPAAVAPAAAAAVAPAAPAPAAVMVVQVAPAAVAVAAPAAPGMMIAPGPAMVVQAPNMPPAGAPGQPAASKEPKAKIPLDEVESIHFERVVAMSGRFIGQTSFDFTMPHPKAKKDEPKKDEPKPGDAKKDEPKPEEVKKAEEAKKDEPKKDEPKKEEPKAEAVAEVAVVTTAVVATEVAAEATGLVQAEAAGVVVENNQAEVAEDAAEPPDPAEVAQIQVQVQGGIIQQGPGGQPGADAGPPPPGTVAAPKAEPKVDAAKNGIRDLCLALAGLRSAPIQQITVNCQTDMGPTTWQLDTTGSQAWPLVVRRSGVEAWAEVYLEPPAGDCFQKDLTVMVQYKDGQAGNAQVKADKHSDAKLAVDPKDPTAPRPDAWLFLAGDEKLFGKVDSIGEEALKFTTAWGDHLDVPMTRVVGIKMALLDPKESADSFARRLKARSSEDVLLARTKDGEVLAIGGVLEGSDNDRLLFRYQEKTRKLPIDMVEGVVMAARPDPEQPDSPRSTFDLPGGVVVTGKWKALEAASWKVETPWGQELNLPAPDVQGVKFRGGRVTYLSDLSPSKVEESPFFGRKFPFRRDVSLLGEPLRMDGKSFDRGVAVHSRSSLTFDLDGRYATFEALVGFDEASKGKGRVDCRVFADGKEIYANPDLRADGPPVALKLPVAGAAQIRLFVDFGKGQDTGDRVIWAEARLTRKESKN